LFKNVHASFFLLFIYFQNKGIEKLDLTPATKCKFSNYEEIDGKYTEVKKFCENGKYFYQDDSYDKVCTDKPKPFSCGTEKVDSKKALTAACKCGYDSDAPMCATGDFCWYSHGTCEKKAYPCEGEMVSYCGPTLSGSDSAMWKPGFEGACFDVATCDQGDINKLMALHSGSGSGSGVRRKFIIFFFSSLLTKMFFFFFLSTFFLFSVFSLTN